MREPTKLRRTGGACLLALLALAMGCPTPSREPAAPEPQAGKTDVAEPSPDVLPDVGEPRPVVRQAPALSVESQAAVAMVEGMGGKVLRHEDGRVIAVDLSENTVSDKEVRQLAPLTDLKELSLRGTGITDESMATIATVSKRDFSGLGKWLFMGLLVVIVGMVANIWLQLPALYLALSVMAIGIFSAWLLYDVQRIVNGGETNYVTATLSIYLSLYNIFVHLLSLLGIFGGDD